MFLAAPTIIRIIMQKTYERCVLEILIRLDRYGYNEQVQLRLSRSFEEEVNMYDEAVMGSINATNFLKLGLLFLTKLNSDTKILISCEPRLLNEVA